jgi:hypothetical protein
MFVGDEVLLDVSFTAARARLVNLIRGGGLLSASEDAYGQGITGLVRVGPAGLSRLVQVQARELAERDGCAGLAIRWEVTGAAWPRAKTNGCSPAPRTICASCTGTALRAKLTVKHPPPAAETQDRPRPQPRTRIRIPRSLSPALRAALCDRLGHASSVSRSR